MDSLRGCAKKKTFQKSEITMEVGVQVSLGIFCVENHPKTALNQYRHFGVVYHMYSVCIYIVIPFRLSFLELKCAPGRDILFLESIFQHSPEEIVHYTINHNSYNKKSIHFMTAQYICYRSKYNLLIKH